MPSTTALILSPLSDTHLTTHTEMTSALVMFERLSQLGQPQRCAPALCVMLFGVFVWWCFLFGAISPLRRSPPPNLLHYLQPCAQPDYSCLEMSQPHASGSDYTLSLMRDSDNAERHTLLSCAAPVYSGVVFASSSAVIYPIAAGSHNKCSPSFYSRHTVGVCLCIFLTFLTNLFTESLFSRFLTTAKQVLVGSTVFSGSW